MYVYGKNVAREILEKSEKVNIAYIDTNFKDEIILSALKKKNICIKYMPKKELDRLANGQHQGIILQIPEFEYCHLTDLLEKEDALLLLLDHIEDPHNLGAIIRTAEAAGVNGIILPKNRSVMVNATVMKTSAGALQNMQIALVTNLNTTIKQLKKQGFWIVGTAMNGTDFEKIDYKGKTVIIIGNEGNGMSRIVTASCDYIASIPMRGKINSLNASVAAGIMIYEAIKQRR